VRARACVWACVRARACTWCVTRILLLVRAQQWTLPMAIFADIGRLCKACASASAWAGGRWEGGKREVRGGRERQFRNSAYRWRVWRRGGRYGRVFAAIKTDITRGGYQAASKSNPVLRGRGSSRAGNGELAVAPLCLRRVPGEGMAAAMGPRSTGDDDIAIRQMRSMRMLGWG
jgi:hypothetical protein